MALMQLEETLQT